MSRIGRKPVPIPQGVEVDIVDSRVTVRGSLGELAREFPHSVSVSRQDGTLVVTSLGDEKAHKALHGLARSLLFNMVTGVSQGYQKTLDIVGVGYRAQKQGDKLTIQVGLSYTPEVQAPKGITIDVEGNNRIIVRGVDKQQVGQVAANIRRLRPPDSYKGKGIRYSDEVPRLKPGKAAAGKRGAK